MKIHRGVPSKGASAEKRPASPTEKIRLDSSIKWRRISELNPFLGNPRKHPEKQIAALARSIERFGITNPVLADEFGGILAGHARVETARRLGLTAVPTLTISGLSEAERKALVIADNRLAEQAVWEIDLLKENFSALVDLNFDVEFTGFTAGEVDLILDRVPAEVSDPDDSQLPERSEDSPVSRPGDLWELGRHRLLCADARDPKAHRAVLGADVAQMVFSDAPYNVRIIGHAIGRGQQRHREFPLASGEMSSAAFTAFLTAAMRAATGVCIDGAIQFWMMDWRHLIELAAAARACGLEQKNLVVWVKTNAGLGSFYRSQHELIGVFKKGTARHVNNFSLGGKGRYRTNVWQFPSVNSLHPARRGDLALHPTVKPVALVADAIRDCSKRNGVILDPFGGSGTTILAAERTGRIARLIELDPRYVDVAVQRWQQRTGIEARERGSGRSFTEVAAARRDEIHAATDKHPTIKSLRMRGLE
jgi:DNA modification methylase